MASTIIYHFTCDLCGNEYDRGDLTRIYVTSQVPMPSSPARTELIDIGGMDATVDVCADCTRRPVAVLLKDT